MIKFIHTADIHLGKTYKNSKGNKERYEDFFLCLANIVRDAVVEKVNFVLLSGDLFHTGQILPKTFAKTIDVLKPLKDAAIPCIAIEGNHDWIHRRYTISWMEALSEMGYIKLLRPSRTEDGDYLFEPFDEKIGIGGFVEIDGLNIYGLGYIGTQAGNHVERICKGVTTENNILLFHVGIWKYSPVEIGNMKIEEALPLAGTFNYVALGHGHKPYIIETEEGIQYAFNPGAPERVNFGEQKYDKGYYLVTCENGYSVEFRTTQVRPMIVMTVEITNGESVASVLAFFKSEIKKELDKERIDKAPLLEVKLKGTVSFQPFELRREMLFAAVEEVSNPLHIEIKNNLTQLTVTAGNLDKQQSLAEIEADVLAGLIDSHEKYKGREKELTELSFAVRNLALKKDVDEDDLLALFFGREQ